MTYVEVLMILTVIESTDIFKYQFMDMLKYLTTNWFSDLRVIRARKDSIRSTKILLFSLPKYCLKE